MRRDKRVGLAAFQQVTTRELLRKVREPLKKAKQRPATVDCQIRRPQALEDLVGTAELTPDPIQKLKDRATGGVRLLLGRDLLVGITPCADFQPPAYPAEIFGNLRPRQWCAGSAANRAACCSRRFLSLNRLFRSFQNLG